MSAQEYFDAFDFWLSQHVNAALKAGKDLAFRDRRFNCGFKLDDDGAAWDYVFLAPGEEPPPGRAWSVYRLHGVAPGPKPKADMRVACLESRREQDLVGRLTAAVFGVARPRAKGRPHLRLVG